MTLRIVSAPGEAVASLLGLDIDMPTVCHVGVDDTEIVGAGGLAWGGGRCWLWFTVLRSSPKYAVAVMRQAEKVKRRAKQFGETRIYTVHDKQFETSMGLLARVGFVFHATENGQDVYRCELRD